MRCLMIQGLGFSVQDLDDDIVFKDIGFSFEYRIVCVADIVFKDVTVSFRYRIVCGGYGI